MQQGYEVLVMVAQDLKSAHDSLLGTRGYIGQLQQHVLDYNEDTPEADAFLGRVEGAWQAFAETVIRAAGGDQTPNTILQMDGQAREIAQREYDKAYQDAVAVQRGAKT